MEDFEKEFPSLIGLHCGECKVVDMENTEVTIANETEDIKPTETEVKTVKCYPEHILVENCIDKQKVREAIEKVTGIVEDVNNVKRELIDPDELKKELGLER